MFRRCWCCGCGSSGFDGGFRPRNGRLGGSKRSRASGRRRSADRASRHLVVIIARRCARRSRTISAGRRHRDRTHHQNVAVARIDRQAHLPAAPIDRAHLIGLSVSHRRRLRREPVGAQNFADLLGRQHGPEPGDGTGRQRRRLRPRHTRGETDRNRTERRSHEHVFPPARVCPCVVDHWLGIRRSLGGRHALRAIVTN